MHIPIPAVSSVARSAPHRRQCLSIFLSVQLVFTRQATTSSKHPFPFPHRTNPTPHEIFHLPRSASQADIKSRCEHSFPLLARPMYPPRRWLPPSFNSPTLFGFLHRRDGFNDKITSWSRYTTLMQPVVSTTFRPLCVTPGFVPSRMRTAPFVVGTVTGVRERGIIGIPAIMLCAQSFGAVLADQDRLRHRRPRPTIAYNMEMIPMFGIRSCYLRSLR